jgi:hypothetical protein
MPELKYEKYVLVETPEHPDHPRSKEKNIYYNSWINTLLVNNGLNGILKEAFYLDCILIWDTKWPESHPHYHDYDEYLVFLGTDPKDPSDLGGEVEMWLDGEKHLITKTAAVFVPHGFIHTPLRFNRVDRPIVFVRAGNTTKDIQAQTHHA